MKKVFILVEGQTEEAFVKKNLNPYLAHRAIHCTPIIVRTKKVKEGKVFKGGVGNYDKVKNDIGRLLNDTSLDILTTMIDYCKFAAKIPFAENISGQTCFEKVEAVEKLFKEDILRGYSNGNKFVPYLQLHEFEALLFASVDIVCDTLLGTDSQSQAIQNIASDFQTPEEINDNPQTVPSKRIQQIFPSYEKVLFGTIITQRIGVDVIRKKCKHFNNWLSKLEQ